MNMCVFCFREEKNAEDLWICSSCVQKLSQLEPEQITELRLHLAASEQWARLEVLDELLGKGEKHNGKRDTKKRSNGSRFARVTRTNKIADKRPQKQKRSTFHKGK